MHNNEQNEKTIIMEDGTKSKISVFSEATNSSSPTILCMPAMGVSARKYELLALNLFENGFNVVTADLRGNGHSSVRVNRNINFGYHEMLIYDWPAIVTEVKKQFPNSPLFLLGHSLGGQLSALYMSSNPSQVDGLILVASCSVYYQGWNFPKKFGILFGTQMAKLIAELLGYFPGRKLGFGGTEAKQVIKDWAHNAWSGRYELKGSSYHFEDLLGKVKKPLLVISFEGDHFAPQKAVENLYEKMNQAELTHWHLTPEEMKLAKLDHFIWIKNPDLVVQKVEKWVTSLESNGKEK